jgi:DNA-binding transcriptional LysR family regulator
MHTTIETDLLRAFVAVADSGGFTRAAAVLHRTQSAVSMQIKRLEESVASPLFQRNGRSIQLTRDGEALLSYARRILSLNDEAMAALTQTRVEGAVRLGCMDDYATAVLPEILARFAADQPRVYVEVHTGLTAHMLKHVGERYDLLLAMHRRGTGSGEVLREEPAVWGGSPTHDVGALDPLPLALAPQGCLFREWAIAALDRKGRRWRMAYMSPSMGAVDSAVASGLAVSVFKAGTLPKRLRALGAKDGLPPLPVAEISLHRAPRLTSRAATELGDFLVENLRTIAGRRRPLPSPPARGQRASARG